MASEPSTYLDNHHYRVLLRTLRKRLALLHGLVSECIWFCDQECCLDLMLMTLHRFPFPCCSPLNTNAIPSVSTRIIEALSHTTPQAR